MIDCSTKDKLKDENPHFGNTLLCAAFFVNLKNIFKKVCTIKILYLNLCTQLK